MRKLFEQLLAAGTENEVQAILDAQGLSGDNDRWRPYGDNEAFYGVVENQQAHPVPALVEKVMNGIDAILEKKVVEHGIDIRSEHAPSSVQDALDRYFPNHKNWDIGDVRRQQARDLQIVASGPRRDTSLLIYDNGVGQAPEDFPNTFLSLLRGNKNDVHFVQGKYNMGGAGAIAFCGDLRYQLVASKRFDGSLPLGFTLLRRHPPKLAAAANRKNTWYEYLVFDGKVASLDIDEMDIGLDGRRFSTGSLLKLYSYRLPEGARSIISRDLNVSLNEYPFVDEDKLSRIYINLDSSVLRDFKSGNRSPDAIELAERRYVSTVYFHTLFLFATTKSRKYSLRRGEDTEAVEDIEIADYIADLFTASYAQFLLSFDTADLVDVIG